jgi:hypothetical protein
MQPERLFDAAVFFGMLRCTRYDAALFAALMSTAIALSGALAHLLALPNKIGLGRDAYFTVQGIYRGWDLFGYVLAIQLLSIIAVIVLARHDRQVRLLAIVALLGLVAAQAVFWTFTYPANVATSNWTAIPDDWETLRRNWEYSHAAGAVFQFVAMTSLVMAALTRRPSAST